MLFEIFCLLKGAGRVNDIHSRLQEEGQKTVGKDIKLGDV